ncbi:uncharacterized protein LOC131165287 [Malania oleifera]|uniref:uncharacterized protein LOC131165287 n=1 Tax=Malania oleifera TaxID=397392 RepID=UPI0025AE0499|nr:uncharacterized protein LOC131165287 [Malania oleifera]
MFMASAQQGFLASALTSAHRPSSWRIHSYSVNLISCGYPTNDHIPKDSSKTTENQLAKLAIVALAAGVLTLGSVHEASAAKTGGRIGGQAFRSSAPRSYSPRIDNSRRNVYINPPLAPPLSGGYGYGFGVPFYGGWGWSPFSLVAPAPSVAIGFGGGFEVLSFILFLGAIVAVVKRFVGLRTEDDEDY